MASYYVFSILIMSFTLAIKSQKCWFYSIQP